MTKLYYTPPRIEIFIEVKEAAMQTWREIDSDNDKYGYATEKINRIKYIANVADNLMLMVAMFDDENQLLLSLKLSDEAKAAIRARMVDGGMPEYLIHF